MNRAKRQLVLLVALLGLLPLVACGDGGALFLRGSARLPTCTAAPAANLDGTVWYDSGWLTIQTAGCGFEVNEVVDVCALNWELSQTGNDVQILVDNEYRIAGRICGEQLHLEGGWWLPVTDANGACTYREANADEVRIEAEGNTLTLNQDTLSGTLVVRGPCTASYDVEFHLLSGSVSG